MDEEKLSKDEQTKDDDKVKDDEHEDDTAENEGNTVKKEEKKKHHKKVSVLTVCEPGVSYYRPKAPPPPSVKLWTLSKIQSHVWGVTTVMALMTNSKGFDKFLGSFSL